LRVDASDGTDRDDCSANDVGVYQRIPRIQHDAFHRMAARATAFS
jgi:hypothetical protein